MPKPKPEEDPIPFLMKLSPKEKAAWKDAAKKRGMPLATFIKHEINKIVFGEPFDYSTILEPLLSFNTDILATCVVDALDKGNVVFATSQWGPIQDCVNIVQQWESKNAAGKPISLYGEKYTLLTKSSELLVAKHLLTKQYLIGAHQGEKGAFFLAIVRPGGNPMLAHSDLARITERVTPQTTTPSNEILTSSESPITFHPENAREVAVARKKRAAEKQGELERIKDSLVTTVVQEILNFQVKNNAEEKTGIQKDILYLHLAEHFDLAKFEIEQILQKNADRVVFPTETTIYVRKIE
jgi:hypothetical protein